MKLIRKYIKQIFNLYDYDDFQIGGTCGLCGKWVKKCIVEKNWSIVICEECK